MRLKRKRRKKTRRKKTKRIRRESTLKLLKTQTMSLLLNQTRKRKRRARIEKFFELINVSKLLIKRLDIK